MTEDPYDPGTTEVDLPLQTDVSNPLHADDERGEIPPSPLWAMQSRRHSITHGGADLSGRLGAGDSTLYFIEDGNEHYMIGRRVGATPSGISYCLVGRIDDGTFNDLDDATTDLTHAFAQARDIALCSVDEEDQVAGEVVLVEHYRHAQDVPAEYLPSMPFIEFADEEQE